MARILIIDDDGGMRSVIQGTVEADGHEVVATADGRSGVARFRSEPFDLVITDLFMPDQDGIQTISEIRELDLHIPILAVSAGAQFMRAEAVLGDASDLGATAVLPKPFAIADLRAVVSRLILTAPTP